MKLSQLLDERHIFLKQEATSKKSLFELIAKELTQLHPALFEESLVQLFTNRERLGCTSIGHGVAIPHCKIPGNNQCIAILITLENPIIFDDRDSTDEQTTTKADIIIALLAPAEATEEHLNLLSEVAELMQSAKLRQLLRNQTSNAKVVDLLSYSLDEEPKQWMSL